MPQILITLLLFGITVFCEAQVKYTPLPANLDGSMMPYDFSQTTQASFLPDSLTPVYASYVARHGSRYLSGPGKIAPVIEALQAGRNLGTLSEKGDAFFTYIENIRKANEGHWGDLSPVGYEEEAKLARRLYAIVSPLHDNNSRVNAVSSYVPRCVMTMYLLTGGVIRENDGLMTSTDEGHQYDRLVCCFTADSLFSLYRKHGDWKPIYDEFVEKNISINPARSLFVDTKLTDSELRKLTMDIYEVLKANRASGLPAPTTEWMSVEEYSSCWRASNLQHYLRNNITPVSDLALQATTPLFDAIIGNIDRAVQMNVPQPVLEGYFGHAETLLPLLSAMKLPGCYEMNEDYERLDKQWKVQNITPLGANLLILISRGPSGRHYASLQLNGRTIRPIPGKPDIVTWTELRDFWKTCLDNN